VGHICLVAKRENPNFASKFIITVMTDYEYILKQAKKFYFTKWDDEELRKCVDMLQTLEHSELVALYHCKWIKKVMQEEIFNILYMDRIGEREDSIKEMSTNELINEFEERSCGNVSLIRQELRHRYKEDFGDDRIKIAAVFRNGTKGDQQWIQLQLRREMNGNKKVGF
jgi:lysine/ornithine N-monooxygenase